MILGPMGLDHTRTRAKPRLSLHQPPLGPVSLDDILYDLPAHGADAPAPALPLLQGALVAEAHVPAHVQHAVHRRLVTDLALVAPPVGFGGVATAGTPGWRGGLGGGAHYGVAGP